MLRTRLARRNSRRDDEDAHRRQVPPDGRPTTKRVLSGCLRPSARGDRATAVLAIRQRHVADDRRPPTSSRTPSPHVVMERASAREDPCAPSRGCSLSYVCPEKLTNTDSDDGSPPSVCAGDVRYQVGNVGRHQRGCASKRQSAHRAHVRQRVAYERQLIGRDLRAVVAFSAACARDVAPDDERGAACRKRNNRAKRLLPSLEGEARFGGSPRSCRSCRRSRARSGRSRR